MDSLVYNTNDKGRIVTKEEAIRKILKVLKSPMMVMSKPNKDEALTLAEEHGITAKDLIETWSDMAMRI